MTDEISTGLKATLATCRALKQPGVVREGFLEEVISEMGLKDVRTDQSMNTTESKHSLCLDERMQGQRSQGQWDGGRNPPGSFHSPQLSLAGFAGLPS